jgi:hypothetical protein
MVRLFSSTQIHWDDFRPDIDVYLAKVWGGAAPSLAKRGGESDGQGGGPGDNRDGFVELPTSARMAELLKLILDVGPRPSTNQNPTDAPGTVPNTNTWFVDVANCSTTTNATWENCFGG